MSFPELLRKKRDGEILSKKEIESFVEQTVTGQAQDCQIGAMLMAIFLRGMTDDETIQLTSALVQSGEVLTWPVEWEDLLVDKHSTGGVGDKVSLPLAPAIAACGLKVPMVSGRGLDFTGGTLDKLEAIPGFTVLLDHAQMEHALREAGCFIAGQTDRLVPGDRELYKRRDVTSTVGSDPLMIASIVSKKAAEGVRALIMDVKVGQAAMTKDVVRGRELAKKLISTAEGLGVKTRTALTRMDFPIGYTIGNALEVAESVECLRGGGPPDLAELVTTLGGVLLHMKGRAETLAKGQQLVADALASGRALHHFETMLRCQGVGAETARQLCHGDMWAVLPRVPSNQISTLNVTRSGYVSEICALEIARVCRELGAGRSRADQPLDLRVGVTLLRHPGDKVAKGEAWMEVHHGSETLNSELKNRLEKTILISDIKPPVLSRIIEIM